MVLLTLRKHPSPKQAPLRYEESLRESIDSVSRWTFQPFLIGLAADWPSLLKRGVRLSSNSRSYSTRISPGSSLAHNKLRSHEQPRVLQPSLQRTQDADGRVQHRAASENHCRRTKRQPPKNYSFILSCLKTDGILFVALIALKIFLVTAIYRGTKPMRQRPDSFSCNSVNRT